MDTNDKAECRCCDGSGCPDCIPNWEEEEQIRQAEEWQEQKQIDDAIAWQEEQDIRNMFDSPHER
jgi:hypothetical protein